MVARAYSESQHKKKNGSSCRDASLFTSFFFFFWFPCVMTIAGLIYRVNYSNTPVFELAVGDVAVMRRKNDSYMNATQILKAAGMEKTKRAKILDREVLIGDHQKVQGGFGKYQGTWYVRVLGEHKEDGVIDIYVYKGFLWIRHANLQNDMGFFIKFNLSSTSILPTLNCILKKIRQRQTKNERRQQQQQQKQQWINHPW